MSIRLDILSQPIQLGSNQDRSLRAMFIRSPSASTSSGLRGSGQPRVRVLVDDSSDDSDSGWKDDNLDVITAPLPTTGSSHEDEAGVMLGEGVDPAEEAPRADPRAEPRTVYQSVFTLGCTTEPVVDSWFQSGYFPDCGSSADDSDRERPCAQDGDEECGAVEVEEENVLASLSRPLRVCDSLPLSAVRLAASLKEPEDLVKDLMEDLPCGDLLLDLKPFRPQQSPPSAPARSVGDHTPAAPAPTPTPAAERKDHKVDSRPDTQRRQHHLDDV